MYDNGIFYELDESEMLARPDEWDWHDARNGDGTHEYIYCTNADWTVNGDDPRNDWGTVMSEDGRYAAWSTSVQNMMCYGEAENFEESVAGLEAAMAHVEESIDRTAKQ